MKIISTGYKTTTTERDHAYAIVEFSNEDLNRLGLTSWDGYKTQLSPEEKILKTLKEIISSERRAIVSVVLESSAVGVLEDALENLRTYLKNRRKMIGPHVAEAIEQVAKKEVAVR